MTKASFLPKDQKLEKDVCAPQLLNIAPEGRAVRIIL